MKNFIKNRLVDETIDFYEPIKRLSLGKFSSLKKFKVKTYNKVIQFSAQSDIFGKISLIQQNRKINLQEVFSYPLGPIPWTLAGTNGELKKSSKAKIMHELEKGVTKVERVDAPFVPIFDGMALVRMVEMLKEEIAQLVKFSSTSSLAPLKSHNEALFYQTTKTNRS